MFHYVPHVKGMCVVCEAQLIGLANQKNDCVLLKSLMIISVHVLMLL